MRSGVRGELRSRPVRVSALQLEPGDLAHQIEFSGQDIAMRASEESSLRAVTEVEVMRDHALMRHVVGVQADVARLAMPDRGLLTRWKPAHLRHPQFDDE